MGARHILRNGRLQGLSRAVSWVRSCYIENMIPVLEEIGSLPDACQTDLARNLWWPARSKRATCSGTSKTRKKMRLVAAHTCPYGSVNPNSNDVGSTYTIVSSISEAPLDTRAPGGW
jgi:hypothetical protein